MRDLFPEYQEPTDEEIDRLWDECIFVCDANVLLDLYRWSENTRDELLRVLRELADRRALWLPHQAAYEYYHNRPEAIAEAASADSWFAEAISSFSTALKNVAKDDRLPCVAPQIIADLRSALQRAQSDLKASRVKADALKDTDTIRPQIEDVFDGCVGAGLDHEEMRQVEAEASRRRELRLPPGYEDTGPGDLIIWFEMIDRAQTVEKPIVFVTRDLKEDWWWQAGEKCMWPRPELIREMRRKAGVRFHAYRTRDFLTEANKRLDLGVSEEAMEEVGRREEATEAAVQQMPWSRIGDAMESAWQARTSEFEEAMEEVGRREEATEAAVQQMPWSRIGDAMESAWQARTSEFEEAMRAAQQMPWLRGVPPLTREQRRAAIEAITYMPAPREFQAGIAAVQRLDMPAIYEQLRRLGLVDSEPARPDTTEGSEDPSWDAEDAWNGDKGETELKASEADEDENGLDGQEEQDETDPADDDRSSE